MTANTRPDGTIPAGKPWVRTIWDIALAAACTQFAGLLTAEVSRPLASPLRTAALVLAVAHAGALVVRRRWPQAVTAWLLASAVAYRGLGLPPMFLGPAALVALYTVTVRTARPVSLRWLAAGLVVGGVGGAGLLDWGSVALNCVLLAGAWVLGDQVSRRQAEAAAHARRAEELEAARGELARHAVTEERLRIARELHDVVAHSLSVVAINAGTGRMVGGKDPAAAQRSLATIEQVTRAALGEMRQLLRVLRDGDEPDGVSPLPGLMNLPQLVAGTADAGLAVEVRIEGERRQLAPGLERAIYRVIQEALTNTIKHSEASSAAVVLTYEPDAIVVTVADPGPRTAVNDKHPEAGSGLAGMRERVALYSGDLDAGPTRRGFRIRATFRVDAAPSEDLR